MSLDLDKIHMYDMMW